MNLFIVESPLQIICAYEAILEHPEEPYFLLIRKTDRGLNDQHLIECAEFFNLKYTTFKLYPDCIKFHFIMNLFLWLKLSIIKFNKVYLGSIYSNALRTIKIILRGKELFYLDDGAATIRAQVDMSNSLLPCSNLFTFFHLNELSGQKIVHHNFSNIRKEIKVMMGKKAYFIGQPVEHMVGFTERDYIDCVKYIAQKFSKNSPLLYVPHRVEDCTKISNIENVAILKLDQPIELYFIRNEEEVPAIIYSCYSSALLSLKVLFPNLDAIAIKPMNMDIQSEGMKQVYHHFSNNKINVIDRGV